ncbi:HpcH/HpaI aldolase/citrate lyase family protein [Hyphococcus sp.]|uniref:HpcH/HpaI aldolase/citrate lyase family protein n=1 Tax=Hyphococcus sp. TaxID=2038636 RepID=UPI0035C75EA5
MKLRSLLFVPGDSEKKFAKACGSNADILILDLEDAVAPSQKPAARDFTSSIISPEKRDWAFFVRINPLDTGMTQDDLSAVVKPGLDGVVLPKANGVHDVNRIAGDLDKLESDAGMALGTVKILVVATETPAAMHNLGSYQHAPSRLIGLTWGAEDLAAAIGARANKDERGEWTFPYQVARAQCLFAASAANVAPIDTLYSDFRDTDGLRRDCAQARRDGFVGRIAIHPAQVEPINESFTPSRDEIEEAQKIVAAFEANPDAGTLGIGGKMYDIPHLKAARRTLSAI